MTKVEFVPDARDEFMAEVAFYEAAQRGLGKKFSSSVEKSASLVSVFTNVGSPSISGTRRVVIKGFPFWLVYKPSRSGCIIIFAIAHQSRRPGYWVTRVS